MSSPSAAKAGRPWWQPTLSHQHGPLVALLVSFLLGAAGAQRWTMGTTAALVVVLLKLRRDPDATFRPVLLFASTSLALVLLGWTVGLLRPLEAAAYGVALLKGGWLLSRLENYRAAPIGRVAAIETGSALLFLLLAALALLPATLPSSG